MDARRLRDAHYLVSGDRRGRARRLPRLQEGHRRVCVRTPPGAGWTSSRRRRPKRRCTSASTSPSLAYQHEELDALLAKARGRRAVASTGGDEEKGGSTGAGGDEEKGDAVKSPGRWPGPGPGQGQGRREDKGAGAGAERATCGRRRAGGGRRRRGRRGSPSLSRRSARPSSRSRRRASSSRTSTGASRGCSTRSRWGRLKGSLRVVILYAAHDINRPQRDKLRGVRAT